MRNLSCPIPSEFLSLMKASNFKVRRLENDKSFNLNIVGWRNLKGRVNCFDDLLSVYYETHFGWEYFYWPATTRPGDKWLIAPLNKKGTAIVVPGQYINTYRIGQHKGQTALVQINPIKVYRDNNRDSQFDVNPATIEEGLFGINIHRAGFWTAFVGAFSAGCQVVQKQADFADFLVLCYRAVAMHSPFFDYTLIEI